MTLLLVLLASCDAAALAVLAKAAARAEVFDLPGALELVLTAGDCDEAAGGAEYLEGLLGGREAIAQGGTVDSLRDVRSAANALSRRAEATGRRWEVASLAMRAVAAASQYERGEMALYLDEAVRLEKQLLSVELPGAPFVTAHELAGDLWLQVHRFEDARAAYGQALGAVGRTPRVKLGLARAAAGLKDLQAACREYASLIEWWEKGQRSIVPQEIAQARSYVESPACARPWAPKREARRRR